jgi:hypothetical protein
MHGLTVYQTTRRGFLGSILSTGLATAGAASSVALPPPANKALIAITLDLEMSRHYPTWDQMFWDYEKGNGKRPQTLSRPTSAWPSRP